MGRKAWAVRYVLCPRRNGIRFFRTESEAREYYRGLWRSDDVATQTVHEFDPGFDLAIRQEEDGLVVRVRVGRRAGRFGCRMKELWNARIFRKRVRETLGLKIPEMKPYEWNAFLEYIAGERRRR